MNDFPRIEVSGDKEGGWLAEIHDGVFHHVFGDLTGANENEVRDAAVAKFVAEHPDSALASEVRVDESVRGEQTAAGFAAVVPPLPAQSPGEQRAAEIIAGNETQAEAEMQAAHEPEQKDG